MKYLQTNLLRDHTAATETIELDLPTNPLSHLIISLSVDNVTDEATLAEIMAFINSITVSDEGRTIVSLESEDLYALQCYITGNRPMLTNRIATDNAHRCLSLIVPFGRRLYDPTECYPARERGNVQLLLDTTIPATSCDGGLININCVQLPEATPEYFLKSRMMSIAAPGITYNQVDLPTGNRIVALLIRQTTIPTTSGATTGVESVKLLDNDVEYMVAAYPYECRVGEMARLLDGMTGTIAAQGSVLPYKVDLVDLDPLKDGNYLWDTSDSRAAEIELTMGVDEATYLTVLEHVASSEVTD